MKKMQVLADTFNYKIGTMPFPSLGLSLGITKPSVAHCLPIVRRIERKLLGCSQFLTQAGKLEMVNTILSSMRTFHMCTILLYTDVYIRQVNIGEIFFGEVHILMLRNHLWQHGT